MQKANDLNRRLAFRRMKFTSPRSSPQFGSAVNSTCTTGLRGEHRVQSHSVQCMLQVWPKRTLYRPSSCSVKEANDYCIINSIGCLCQCHNSMWTLFVLHMSSDTNFDCYRVCTLPCMQNWHFWHHTSPFLNVTLLAVTRDSWQIFIGVSFTMWSTGPD